MRSLTMVAAAMLAGCVAEPIVPAALGGASLVAFEKIHTPEEIAALLESYAAFPGVDVKEVGASAGGRPLHRVVVGDGPFTLWAVGRHHGNEPTGAEGILLVLRLLAEPGASLPADAPPILATLLEHRDFVRERVRLVVVPVVNPDGAAAFTRGNPMTPDPNRDYAAFHTPESRIVRDAFWEARPDQCLDLHNEGESERFDYDAFVPIALPEGEVQNALTAQAWRAVHEVDASGGFGGGPNENYYFELYVPVADVGVPLPVRVVDPTAVHPGTHDMFCSLRGAPGWTPEGAIPWDGEGGGNGGTHPAYAWSARLHAITLASALLDAAGAYDGFAAPFVEKMDGAVEGVEAKEQVLLPRSGRAQIQVVWRESLADPSVGVVPAHVEVVTPSGKRLDARLPAPNAYTATVFLPAAEAGAYDVTIRAPVGTEYEVRTRLLAADAAPIAVAREGDVLVVENRHVRPVRVLLSDVADAPGGAAFPEPSRSALADGPVAPRFLVEWALDLSPGEVARLTHAGANRGPWRYTAVDGPAVATGVEGERSTR